VESSSTAPCLGASSSGESLDPAGSGDGRCVGIAFLLWDADELWFGRGNDFGSRIVFRRVRGPSRWSSSALKSELRCLDLW
jgi:hypothetical protein